MLTMRTNKGKVTPLITCCQCRQPIHDASDGIVVVAADGVAQIVHRSGGDFACDRRPPGSTWLPLELLLLRLQQNCRFDVRQAEANASLWGQLP